MDLGIKGRHALITGGSHGIGLAAAMSLAAEGVNIAICSRSEMRLKEAASKLSTFKTEVLTFQTDVLVPDEIEKTVTSIIDKWGGVDILVNNVGGGGRWGLPSVEDTEEKVWLEVYEKNALAAIRFTRAFIPEMRRRKWGRVVTVTSRLGREGGGRAWFNMAKAAQTSMMKTLGMTPELLRDGITFNSVAPGGVFIEGTGWDEEKRRDQKAFEAKTLQEFPMGRLGNPEEVGDVIAFICSKRSSLVTGAAIAVDGGESRAF